MLASNSLVWSFNLPMKNQIVVVDFAKIVVVFWILSLLFSILFFCAHAAVDVAVYLLYSFCTACAMLPQCFLFIFLLLSFMISINVCIPSLAFICDPFDVSVCGMYVCECCLSWCFILYLIVVIDLILSRLFSWLTAVVCVLRECAALFVILRLVVCSIRIRIRCCCCYCCVASFAAEEIVFKMLLFLP